MYGLDCNGLFGVIRLRSSSIDWAMERLSCEFLSTSSEQDYAYSRRYQFLSDPWNRSVFVFEHAMSRVCRRAVLQ